MKLLLYAFSILALVAACGTSQQGDPQEHYDNVTIEDYDTLLTIYYPNFRTIEMAYGSDVPTGDDILFCCGAAFTAECLKHFTHTNIRCNHVNNGHFYHGSDEPICNGAFTFYDGEGHFDRISDSVLRCV